MKNKKMSKKLLPIILVSILLILSIIGIFLNRRNSILEMSPQLLRTQKYETADGDDEVNDTRGDRINGLTFNAFFLTDTNGDGEEERIRGTCNEIGNEANLYMDINLTGGGKINNATI